MASSICVRLSKNALCSQHYGLFILDRLAVPATQHIQSVIVPVGSCHLWPVTAVRTINAHVPENRICWQMSSTETVNERLFHGIGTGLQEQTLLRNKSSTSRRFRRFLEGGLRSVLPSDHHAEQTRKRLWGTRTSFLCYMVVLDQSEARPNQCDSWQSVTHK